MDYSLYRAEDFASDESFINYYLKQNAEDEAFWAHWISTHPERLDEVLTAERLIAMLTLSISDEDYEQELKRFQSSIRLTEPDSASRPGNRWWFTFSGIAASVVVGLIVIFWASRQQDNMSVRMLTTHTLPGQQKAISLSDGTKIILNGAATLEYPERFSGKTREVNLKGEAYFEVAKDKKHPFTVHAGNLNTTVLGTKFNINYKNVGDIRVSLLEGRVRVTENGLKGNLLLMPGGQARLFAGHLMMNGFDAEEVVAWKNYGLKLNGASFEEVAEKMYKTFGVHLLNKSNDQHWAYSGTFAHTDYLTIVRTIAYAKHLRYEINKDTVIIR